MSTQQFAALYFIILIALIALLTVLLAQYFRQRTGRDFSWLRRLRRGGDGMDDVEATEIAEIPQVEAYLIAEDDTPGLPMQINLSTATTIVIGRDKTLCNIVLRDIGISREHAKISYYDIGFQIKDLGSKGGTFLDRRRLEKDRAYPLTPGVLVQFYNISYRFEMADEQTEKYDEYGTLPTDGGEINRGSH
jgi:hypothetical protein